MVSLDETKYGIRQCQQIFLKTFVLQWKPDSLCINTFDDDTFDGSIFWDWEKEREKKTSIE